MQRQLLGVVLTASLQAAIQGAGRRYGWQWTSFQRKSYEQAVYYRAMLRKKKQHVFPRYSIAVWPPGIAGVRLAGQGYYAERLRDASSSG